MNRKQVSSQNIGLYRKEFERDNCGFGLIAHMDAVPSHKIVNSALEALIRLTHRGAVAADGKSGDGCGLLLSLPEKLLRDWSVEEGYQLAAYFGVAMVFLSQDIKQAKVARELLEKEVRAQGLIPVAWRKVPIKKSILGELAKSSLPIIEQLLVNLPEEEQQRNTNAEMSTLSFERKLFMARRKAEKQIIPEDKDFYISSMSCQSVVYKGLFIPKNMATFYQDLQNPLMESSVGLFHQRFSTNTSPEWRLAQPFRFLAHNGEINTIKGNRNWALARSYKFDTQNIDMDQVRPFVYSKDSDSMSLDNMLEVLLMGGMNLFRAVQMMVPPAWQNAENIDPGLKAFYRFHAMHMEPWDGPAGLVMANGRYVACALDRNGLRPARYMITNDRFIVFSSEVGVFDHKPQDVIEKGRLSPGEMYAVDTQKGTLLRSQQIRDRIKNEHPYKKWIWESTVRLPSTLVGDEPQVKLNPASVKVYKKMFQVTTEECEQVIRVLAQTGHEAIGSMGDDTPMAVLSTKERNIYDYFRQQFAQVTNPPIDPLREKSVMSLETYFGQEQNLFDVNPGMAKVIFVSSPVLSTAKFNKLMSIEEEGFYYNKIDITYSANESLENAIEEICQQAVDAVKQGNIILVLSDRNIAKDMIPVHAALAIGAVHQRLTEEGLRCGCNLVIETATARDSHQFAVLLGYGATAIHPYLAYETLREMHQKAELYGNDSTSLSEQMRFYRRGINKGLYKIISKMGISTISSYRGSQLFEVIGLDKKVINLCFKGTVSRIEGADFNDLHKQQVSLAKQAWNSRTEIRHGGLLKYVHGEEYHAYNPDVVKALQEAVSSGDYEKYLEYAGSVNKRPAMVLRDLFGIKKDRTSINISQVESEEQIVKRFDSAGMSLGALSPEAHESLAEAMNTLGGRSNSGEGGEHPDRYGTLKMSKIKQVASGRFGVTPHYLVNAEVLQIKIAQGAKPGEGGQLPGHKVDKMIASLRYSKPGVALISPPPHHDIYSIEDLAQLIFDLKQVNPEAKVSVKLVAEPGVGTVAAGVAKAYADLITISGYDGGTGASPLTSVRYAGSAWELGLSEAHQTLQINNLRDKVQLQTDGGLKTGLDVIKAAILGAESFAFGTGPMVALGCKYLRICHLNNCATGVATQNKILRSDHFIGTTQKVINYFRFVAQETREWMAKLGISKFEDLIGRVELLDILEGQTDKQKKLDLKPILFSGKVNNDSARFCTNKNNQPYDKGELAEQMVQDILPAINNKVGGHFDYEITNTNRSIGARVSGEIARRHGNLGMESEPVRISFKGTAGQSFGVWNAGGLNLFLEGDANDYVGKGMAGGEITIVPPRQSQIKSYQASIIGNTCLYGATGGRLFASGCAGERFAVRNSGAVAVIEGAGDHCCEYMTGGVVLVLGETGVNFGAGMTGGVAFVLDMSRTFIDSYNNELVDIHRLMPEPMEAYVHYLRDLLQEYVEVTGSAYAKEILQDFPDLLPRFWLVKPKASDLTTLIESLSEAA